jgi:First Longin domain of FUZ, MON1 and HPS1
MWIYKCSVFFSILLIVCADGIDHENLIQLLEVVFSAMVIRVGLTELKEPKNLERLKREIKVPK